jgi:hypothetical protein
VVSKLGVGGGGYYLRGSKKRKNEMNKLSEGNQMSKTWNGESGQRRRNKKKAEEYVRKLYQR